MRRFFSFVVVLLLALPVGISISGCTSNPDANYCNNQGHGLKKGAVYTISLTPVQGISLAYGQTGTVTTPTAADCTGAAASVATYTYLTDNPNLADISPSGSICAGTWNKFSAGGTPTYTVCTPATTSGVVNLWATGGGVSSNKIPVYIHPPISSLVLNNTSGKACISQGVSQTLSVSAYTANADGTSSLLCPTTDSKGNTVSCSAVIGSLSYSPVNSNVATIDQYGNITAKEPGSTAITATLSGVSSTAGYFTACPPVSLSLSLPSGSRTGTIANGVSQTLNSSAVDANGTALSGLTLDYTSTIPANVTVSSSGSLSSTYPGTANIYAFCQPSNCNPSPLDKVGQLDGTGLPIVSNQVHVTASGASSTYLWLGSPNKSQYFVPVDMFTGTVESPVRLPYMPNSMVLDQSGTSLYFGSYRELMVYSATTNSLSTEDTSVPGVVLAVSPDNSQVLINDQTSSREIFYLYSVSGKTYTSYGGIGSKAAFSPDGKTLYILGPKTGDYANKLFVYNTFTGWHTYDLSASGSGGDLAILAPHVGAYFAGSISTVARGYCWDTATGTAYPQADSAAVATDHLAATSDGLHVVATLANTNTAATTETTTLYDMGINNFGFDITSSPAKGVCPSTLTTSGGLGFSHTLQQTSFSLTKPAGYDEAINQVVAASDSSLAFVTYDFVNSSNQSYTTASTTGGALPYYKPGAVGSIGTVGTVTLAGTATAPLGGAFSPDNSLFFVGTSGDNLVHLISTSTLTDTKQLNPKLVDSSGNAVAPTVIWVHPRATN